VDDRRDIVKHHAEYLVAQIVDDQAGGLGSLVARSGLRRWLTGWGPNIKSVSSLLLPAPIC
jgi:hypothetical protein